jgi:TolB-like protein
MSLFTELKRRNVFRTGAAYVVASWIVIQVAEARQLGRNEARPNSYGDKSIVVMPFVNMSSDEEQEYFSDGISEELLNLLARIPDLKVISRRSAFSYKGKDVKLTQVAQDLDVNHILEGSVRRSGDQIRITAQLIDRRSDSHIWSETFDRPWKDIFAIQDEVAAAVVERLKVTLVDEANGIEKTDPDAYALYLQAGSILSRKTPEDTTKAGSCISRPWRSIPSMLPPGSGYHLSMKMTLSLACSNWSRASL